MRSPAAGLNVPVDWVELLLGPASQPQGAPFVFTGGPGVERWLYSPRLSLAGGLSLPVKSPGRHTALVFRQLCAEVGISLGQPQAMPAPLAALANHLHASLREHGFVLEDRPFAAHVTVLRKAKPPPSLPALPRVEWPVYEMLLVRSRTSPKGSTYEPVERFPLQA